VLTPRLPFVGHDGGIAWEHFLLRECGTGLLADERSFCDMGRAFRQVKRRLSTSGFQTCLESAYADHDAYVH
jgi:hypothetical protein